MGQKDTWVTVTRKVFSFLPSKHKLALFSFIQVHSFLHRMELFKNRELLSVNDTRDKCILCSGRSFHSKRLKGSFTKCKYTCRYISWHGAIHFALEVLTSLLCKEDHNHKKCAENK